MTTANILGNLFPSVSDIPEKYRLDGQVEQREYLVDGQLRRWDGPLATVRSPVYLHGENGDEQVILGSTPLLDADTALTALDAAVRAYDRGQGLWPTMRVAERIQHVEAFLGRMRQQRSNCADQSDSMRSDQTRIGRSRSQSRRAEEQKRAGRRR